MIYCNCNDILNRKDENKSSSYDQEEITNNNKVFE